MNQYRIFKWWDKNLIFLGEEITDDEWEPNEEVPFEDDDGKEKDWIVSELLCSNPKKIKRPGGKVYEPDPIAILRPK